MMIGIILYIFLVKYDGISLICGLCTQAEVVICGKSFNFGQKLAKSCLKQYVPMCHFYLKVAHFEKVKVAQSGSGTQNATFSDAWSTVTVLVHYRY